MWPALALRSAPSGECNQPRGVRDAARGGRRSFELADLLRKLACQQLELDVFGVERRALLRCKRCADRLNSVDRPAKLQPLDPNRGHRSMPCGENRPHVRAKGIDGALEIFETRRRDRRTRKTSVDLVERVTEGWPVVARGALLPWGSLDQSVNRLTAEKLHFDYQEAGQVSSRVAVSRGTGCPSAS